jgi:predicted ATPase
MPLAIELAAARLRTMSVDQLANRLDDRFRLLTGGSRTALPRHRTLRAMVDWSWELLTDAERTVLRRLSVFSGGASLEAAEQVCAGDAVEQTDVLELLTALTEKSLLVAAGDDAPRYRMLGTIKEYATQRLAEAGETELARHAHLAHFTELTETADHHLRRAEQLTWLATLATEHDNITAAMRGALAAGEAQAAMRLAAGSGWYWWLSGHKAEGVELLTAAHETPGEVTDEIRVVVYAYMVGFASSGRGADQYSAAEWIHKVHDLSRHVRIRHPAVELAIPLENLLQKPDDPLSAWESMLDNEDPWVRAMGQLHLGKTRVLLGDLGRDVDACFEKALAEFRALGERWGMSFALTELADHVAVRGEFAAACAYLDQAIVVVTEVGATEDVIRIRARQAEIYWLMGSAPDSAAAIAEAERCAQRVTWPEALVELAMSKATLASWRGDAEEAHRHLAVATELLGDKARDPNIRAGTRTLLGRLADDLDSARSHHTAACRAAVESDHRATIALVLVGVADLALRLDQPAQAARLLAASTTVRGLVDRSNPEMTRLEQAVRDRLGEVGFAEAAQEGTETDWNALVEVTLAS